MFYNIVLNSNNRSNVVNTDSITNSDYFFDWSSLPEGRYKLQYSFVSTNINQAAANYIPVIYVGFGQTKNYTSDPLRTSALSTLVIGVAVPYCCMTAQSFLYSDKNLNHPLVIDRPTQNNFRVNILTNEKIPKNWSDNDGTQFSYVLTLSLEKL